MLMQSGGAPPSAEGDAGDGMLSQRPILPPLPNSANALASVLPPALGGAANALDDDLRESVRSAATPTGGGGSATRRDDATSGGEGSAAEEVADLFATDGDDTPACVVRLRMLYRRAVEWRIAHSMFESKFFAAHARITFAAHFFARTDEDGYS